MFNLKSIKAQEAEDKKIKYIYGQMNEAQKDRWDRKRQSQYHGEVAADLTKETETKLNAEKLRASEKAARHMTTKAKQIKKSAKEAKRKATMSKAMSSAKKDVKKKVKEIKKKLTK